ncbi:hypothetical protein LI160_01525 [Bacteroides xylanisolvens]|uniref:hypothetical protein n=1 Tax=Bacteroides xylanisolvens TaxID=371601 RepID=UPI001D060020|nr:hypothetical protein [Bacteroides xylanisolvens]MCB6712267.1 hypothetical protein [Bacteroides xylanisolvens]MCB6732323.1 hypothetical protein [Bacteroides xylanisolvens]MCB7119716.1 hypothetical protein [Bacteroides xylanisolvens]
MKVDLNKYFKDYRGQETTELIADKVAEAMYSAGAIPEWKIKREDKFKAYKICQKILTDGGVIEIETEEATLIKEVCANFFSAGAYGQVHELIEKEV